MNKQHTHTHTLFFFPPKNKFLNILFFSIISGSQNIRSELDTVILGPIHLTYSDFFVSSSFPMLFQQPWNIPIITIRDCHLGVLPPRYPKPPTHRAPTQAPTPLPTCWVSPGVDSLRQWLYLLHGAWWFDSILTTDWDSPFHWTSTLGWYLDRVDRHGWSGACCVSWLVS